MGSYKHKDGTRIVTETVYDKAMTRRGVSKLVHIIPAHPVHESPEFAQAVAAYFGPSFQSKLFRANEVADKSPERKDE